MPWDSARLPHTPETMLLFGASIVVCICVSAVLAAVLLNFATVKQAAAVEMRKRSPVATASMLAFCAAYYLVIHARVGVVPIGGMAPLIAVTAVGLVLMVVGACVNIVGRLRLGGNWADHVTIYEDQTLVQSGVFGIVRHPLYASILWMLYGAALIYHNWIAFALSTLVFAPAMVYRADQEERLLADRFPEYAAYRKRVGRLMPRVPRGAKGQ